MTVEIAAMEPKLITGHRSFNYSSGKALNTSRSNFTVLEFLRGLAQPRVGRCARIVIRCRHLAFLASRYFTAGGATGGSFVRHRKLDANPSLLEVARKQQFEVGNKLFRRCRAVGMFAPRHLHKVKQPRVPHQPDG